MGLLDGTGSGPPKCTDCMYGRKGLAVGYCVSPKRHEVYIRMGPYDSPCAVYRRHEDACGEAGHWFAPSPIRGGTNSATRID